MYDLCRLCLSISDQLKCIISEESEILNKICTCIGVQISLNDLLPNKVCLECVKQIKDFYNFREKAADIENNFLQLLNYGKEAIDHFYSNIKNNLEVKNEINVNENKDNLSSNIKVEDTDTNNLPENIHYTSYDYYDDDDNENLSKLREKKKRATEKVKRKKNKKKKKTPLTDSKESDLVLNDKHFDDKVPLNLATSNLIEPEFADNFTIAELEFKCLMCDKVYEKQNKLLQHYNDDHRLNRIKDVSKTKTYTVVTSELGYVTYKCDECDKVYNNKRYIDRHILTHVVDRPFTCKMCDRAYKSAYEIVRHGRVHSGFKMNCRFKCGYGSVYLGALREHEMRHKNQFKYACEKCGKGFLVRSWYEQHQNIHNGVRPYVCDLCGVAFHMERYLQSHRSSVHQITKLKKYKCTHCSILCDSRKALTQHLKSHGIIGGCLCDICGKVLSNPERLKNHKRVHTGLKPYTCGTCNKSFAKKFTLDMHMLMHTGERSHACMHCGQYYKQRGTLLRHIRTVHSPSAPKCIKCKKPFSSRRRMAAHVKRCTEASEDDTCSQ